MAFTVTVTGEVWNEADYVTAPKLQRTGSPTVSVVGAMSALSNWNTVAAVSKVFTWFGSLDEITVASHGLTGPASADAAIRVYVTSSGTLPAGLTASTEFSYYARVVDGNTLTLHTTPLGAAGDGTVARVAITSAGTPTHHINWIAPSTAGAPVIYNSTTGKFELGWVQRQNLPDALGATSTANGARGAVPQPTSSDAGKFLRADMTWVTPPAGSSGDLFNAVTFV